MYCYLYDQQIGQKKYDEVRRAIETRIIDVGISGRIERLTSLSSLSDQIASAISQGAKTMVVIGDDATLVRAIAVMAAHPQIALGFLTTDPHSFYGAALGIPTGAAGCDIIAQRLVIEYDLMQIGSWAVLGSAWWTTHSQVSITCNDRFTLQVPPQHHVTIANLGTIFSGDLNIYPADQSQLHLTIQAPVAAKRWRRQTAPPPTIMTAQSLLIVGSEIESLTADQILTIATPVSVTVQPRGVRLIVGRSRLVPTS